MRVRPHWRKLAGDTLTRICLAVFALAVVSTLLAQIAPDRTSAWEPTLFDPLLAGLTFVVLLWGRGRFDNIRERRFWDLLALAWLCQLLVHGIYFFRFAHPVVSAAFTTDLLYLFFYLTFALAIELRPHLGTESSPTVARRWLEGTAGLMAVFGLITYFALVVLPAPRGLSLNVVAAERGILPYLMMRGSIDVFLLGRVLFPALGTRGRWRRTYLLLAAALLCYAIRDGVLLFHGGPPLEIRWLAALWNVFLILPAALVVLAARLRHLDNGGQSASDVRAVAREDMLRASPLAVYMLIVPVVHLLLYPLDLLDSASRGARDVFSLLYLLVVGFLAARHQKILETDRRRAMDSLEAEIENRERVNRELELRQTEMEQFTYTISHELRAPLVTIHGFSSLLERELGEGGGTGAEHLGRIRKATSDMSQLLVELLDLSRVGWVLERSPDVSLTEVARNVCSRLAIQLDANAETRIRIDPDMPRIEADEQRLEDLLTNLVTNAIKFTPARESPQIHIGCRAGDPPVFFVSDRGRGIPLEAQDKVFGLFNRLDHPEIEGTGVGLALVKRIVEKHGGRVWVESAGPGAGTTFCFTIPPAPAPSPVS